MKKLFLLLALVCFFGIKINYAQAPDWTRVLQSGTFGVQNGNVVTADANYVYMAGGISGPITFGGSGFTSVGLRDLIISKISNAGTFSWTKQFNAQANGTIIPNAIKTDASGNVYLSCSFTGTATIGTSTMTSDATKNSFLVKFDASGNVTWANSYLSTGSGSTKIAIDGSGNSYLNSKSSKLIKFNSSGAIQWEQSFYDRTIQAIAIYGSNLYIGGALQGSTTFGTINLTPLGGYNTGYLVKADLNGVYSSSVVVGGSTSYDGSTVSDIVMDNSGNLIITGAYQKNLVLGTITITNTPADEYYYNYTYIAKCSNTFSFSWAKSSTRFYNVNREMWNFRLFTDNSNNIYEYGILVNSFNFGTIPVSPNNGQFLVKFDASGIATNAYELQNTTYNKVYITPAGKVLTTGSYNYNGATTYGNLYLNQYSGVMALEWQKNSSGSQSGTMGVNYVKHDALGNTYVQSSVLGDCNYSGTLYTSDYNQTIITKHDVAGNVIWTNQIADLNLRTLYNGIEGPRFTLDKDNNVLTVGV
ncbi:MAG: hypothetical protein NT144_03055, partial [Bacteroidia bacterium]|nr:hypothetical protein [Bacteroidia bacterium]